MEILTNLTSLNLSDNQLIGFVPNEICNQGDNSPTLENNQLCTVPNFRKENIGSQETSNCPIELWGNFIEAYAINLNGDEISGPIPPEIGND